MDRGDWRAAVQRAAQSDTTEVTEHAHRSQKMSCVARCLPMEVGKHGAEVGLSILTVYHPVCFFA